jgi:hypothetical protein
VGLRATARVFEGAPHPVRGWLGAAAEPRQAWSRDGLCDVPVRQRPLDELDAVLRAVTDGPLGAPAALTRLERSPRWVGTAMDPESPRLRAIDVGDRPRATAQRLGHQVVQGVAPGGLPWFLTDGDPDSLTALLTHYGQWVP